MIISWVHLQMHVYTHFCLVYTWECNYCHWVSVCSTLWVVLINCTNLNSLKQFMSLPGFPHPCLFLVFSVCLILAIWWLCSDISLWLSFMFPSWLQELSTFDYWLFGYPSLWSAHWNLFLVLLYVCFLLIFRKGLYINSWSRYALNMFSSTLWFTFTFF